MKISTIALGIAVLFAGIVAVWFYLWPQSLSWFSFQIDDTAGTFVVNYEKGHPSVRVSNGKIVSREQYDLSFPFSGRVTAVLASAGQSFSESGQPLVQLDSTQWELERKKAEAQYNAQQAIVNKLEQGARFEELLVMQQKKQSSDSSLKGTKKEAIDTITSAYVQSDDAIRNKTDVIFTNPETNPQLSFTPSDASLESRIESGRVSMRDIIGDWKDDVGKMKTTGNVTKYLDDARSKLKKVREYLDQVALGVNALTAGAITQETIDTWKASVSDARSAVAEATVALSSHETAYKVANRDLSVAQGELNARLAGTARQDIEAALSAAVAARSEMDIASEKLKQTTLVTPLKNLLIKKILPQPGEHVEAGAPVVLAASPELEIELDIPEEKIAGIMIGNQVIMRLNAYPYEDITGAVTDIQSQEVEKEGSTYFRSRTSLNQTSEKIRTGMTGDVIVETNTDANMVRIPKGAIHELDGRRTVTVMTSSGRQERVIESGVERDNQVEILSGLQPGERIVYGQ